MAETAAQAGAVSPEAHVIRDGTPRYIDAEEVVPGDLVLISCGDKVPADIKLQSTFSLAIDESLI